MLLYVRTSSSKALLPASVDIIERESVDSEEGEEENVPQRTNTFVLGILINSINIIDIIMTSINSQYMRVYCASKSLFLLVIRTHICLRFYTKATLKYIPTCVSLVLACVSEVTYFVNAQKYEIIT